MAITSGQLKIYLTGGVSNNNPDLSLGGVTSTTELQGGVLENLFSNVGPSEAWDGSIKYRAIDFKNTSAQTAYGGLVYISTETTSADTQIDLAYDTGTQTIPDEDTAPSSPALTFTHPLSPGGGVALGDMAAGTTKRVWIRRTVSPNASATSLDQAIIRLYVGSL